MFDLLSPPRIDEWTAQLREREAEIARLRSEQAALVQRLEWFHVADHDGARSMLEWTTATLDVDDATARKLTHAARFLGRNRRLTDAAATGEVTFDRAVATAKLVAAGASDDAVADSFAIDLAAVRRLTARHRRLTPQSEAKAYRERFFAMQPTLDNNAARFWGQLPGFESRILEDALDQRADKFREMPGPASPAGARRADALVSIAQDSLDPDRGRAELASRDPLVTVFVDASLAGATQGGAGAEVEFGPKVGPVTLERILCAGAVQVVGVADGQPIAASAATRAIPPAVRRFVAFRDGGCTIDGCRSRYRLQPHHVVPWTEGGSHAAGNLTTLCWYHHHVTIHGDGYRLDLASPPLRRRLMSPSRGPGPPRGP